MYVYTIDYSHLQHMMYDALHLFYLPYGRRLDASNFPSCNPFLINNYINFIGL